MAKKLPRTEEEIRDIVAARLKTIKSWKLSLIDLELMIAENPHVYSPVSGFFAEYKCRQLYLDNNSNVAKIVRPSGYDKQQKGDFTFLYRDKPIRLEVKSLDGPSVVDLGTDQWRGTFQCNASDAREVTLPNGRQVKTNCIVSGGWDVLAVNLSAFGGAWRFAFAQQCHLPRASKAYEERDRQCLLASSMQISLPLAAPYTWDFEAVLEAIVRER